MFINWNVTARFDPSSLESSTQGISTHGIPIPTYGNYGGPNYTAGVEGGTTPGGPNPIPKPVDDLDTLFWQHDLAYQQVKDGLVPPQDIPNAIAQADVTLVEGLYALTKTNLDPEAFLYDALATLTIGAKILTTPSELAYLQAHPLDAVKVLTAVQAALPNFEHGLAETSGSEARSLNGAFHVFEARFAQQLTQAMASFAAPSTPGSLNISANVTETSHQPLLTTPQHA